MHIADVAALITSMSVLLGVVLTYRVASRADARAERIEGRVEHVVALTNSNFHAMQDALSASIETNREQAAAAVAKEESA